jgi:hypothetical protein
MEKGKDEPNVIREAMAVESARLMRLWMCGSARGLVEGVLADVEDTDRVLGDLRLGCLLPTL